MSSWLSHPLSVWVIGFVQLIPAWKIFEGKHWNRLLPRLIHMYFEASRQKVLVDISSLGQFVWPICISPCGNFWQLSATFGKWWQLWATFGNLWQLDIVYQVHHVDFYIVSFHSLQYARLVATVTAPNMALSTNLTILQWNAMQFIA